MKRTALTLVLCLAALFAAREARAGGFEIYEHSALATGMADARTALWDDPSSLFYNPAAIAELDGYQLVIGDTLIFAENKYDPALPDCESPTDTGCGEPAKTKSHVFYPLHLYFTAEITRWLKVGSGVNNPFGLGTFWPPDWDGRFTAWQTDLKTFFFQPTLAIEIARLAHLPEDFAIAIGVGGYYVYSQALIRSKLYDAGLMDPDDSANMKLEGSGHGGGYHFSLFAAWKPWISLGASVRSNVPVNYSGTANFWAPEGEVWADFMRMTGLLPEKTGGSTRIEMPWNMNFGLAFHGLKKFTFAIDVYVTLWESYDTLKVHFDCADIPAGEPGSCAAILNQEAVYPKKWHTGVQLSFGAEYRPIRALAIRLGYGYVTDPSNPAYYDAMLPDGNRHLICFGIGYRAPRIFKMDLGYMLAFWEGTKDNDIGVEYESEVRNAGANGKYKTMSHLLGITIGLSFGGAYKGEPQTLDPRPEPPREALLPAPTADAIAPEAAPAVEAAPAPVVPAPVPATEPI